MQAASPSETPSPMIDDCTICLSSLAPGTPLLTLSCNHKFHLQCLASNVQAQNKECPLCRAAIDASVIQLLVAPIQSTPQVVRPSANARNAPTTTIVIPSVEDPIDEVAVQALCERVAAAREAALASSNDHLPLITAVTTLEYRAQVSHEETNIYGLVTLQAPPILQPENEASSTSRVPVDLICVVDQSGSMRGEKMTLLRQTLTHIVEQLNELDRLAIISFNTTPFDRSHGLKRMNQQNQQILKDAIDNDISSSGGTYIGSGLNMGIDLLRNRQTKNPMSALLLLTDGQDTEQHDYTPLMQTLPEEVQCHTFGYGPDHTASLLVQLAQQGNGGTFTYIDEQQAIGSAFGMVLGGLFTCVAQQIQVSIELTGEYKITHFHSKYPYEPQELPSSKLSVRLHNLNADEKRNLVFQLHVPKLNDEQNIEMTSQQPMSQDESPSEQQFYSNEPIGHVIMTYIDPGNNRSMTTIPVSFELVRATHPFADLLQVNPTLDCQRNRIETAHALEEAMRETHFQKSRAILKDQVEKIKKSVSAQEPFCQELISDLEQSYPSEQVYRSSHHNTYMCHQTERGTYIPTGNTSSEQYRTGHQRRLASHIQRKYFS